MIGNVFALSMQSNNKRGNIMSNRSVWIDRVQNEHSCVFYLYDNKSGLGDELWFVISCKDDYSLAFADRMIKEECAECGWTIEGFINSRGN